MRTKIIHSRHAMSLRDHIGKSGGSVHRATAGRHRSFPGHIVVRDVRSARVRSSFPEKMTSPASSHRWHGNGIPQKMHPSPHSRSRHTAICASGGSAPLGMNGKRQSPRVRIIRPAARIVQGAWCSLDSTTCSPIFRRLPRSGIPRLTVHSHRMQSHTAAKRRFGGNARKGMSGVRWSTPAQGQKNAAVRSAPDASGSTSRSDIGK